MRHALVPRAGTQTFWSHLPPAPGSTVRRSPATEDSQTHPLPVFWMAISTRFTARVFLLTPLAEPAVAVPRNTRPAEDGLRMLVSPGRTMTGAESTLLLAIETSSALCAWKVSTGLVPDLVPLRTPT